MSSQDALDDDVAKEVSFLDALQLRSMFESRGWWNVERRMIAEIAYMSMEEPAPDERLTMRRVGRDLFYRIKSTQDSFTVMYDYEAALNCLREQDRDGARSYMIEVLWQHLAAASNHVPTIWYGEFREMVEKRIEKRRGREEAGRLFAEAAGWAQAHSNEAWYARHQHLNEGERHDG